MKWSEFSLILKPSKIGGVGVFATHNIDSNVRLFDRKFEVRTLKKSELPLLFHKYGIHKNDTEFFCPTRFDRIEIGWFINHSENANIHIKRNKLENSNSNCFDSVNPENYYLYTYKKISAGDELLVDYKELEEPEEFREDYY